MEERTMPPTNTISAECCNPAGNTEKKMLEAEIQPPPFQQQQQQYGQQQQQLPDYRSAAAVAPDSTTTGSSLSTARNSDPSASSVVGISFRPLEEKGGENLIVPVPPPMPQLLSTGYVNTKHQETGINCRPREPEPMVECMGRGKHMAGFEVDFDPKFTDEYAKLDDVRGTYDLARGESPTSPERLQSAMNPIYGGIPNYAKKEKTKAKCSCVLSLLISVLVLTNLASLGLGAFNLFNTHDVGTISGEPLTMDAAALVEDTPIVRELRRQIEELQQNLSLNWQRQEARLGLVTMQFEAINSCCSSTSPPAAATTAETQSPSSPPGETTPPPNNTETTPNPATTATAAAATMETTPLSTEPTTARPLPSAHLSENCTVTLRDDCDINSGLLLTSTSGPSVGNCFTESISIVDTAEGHVTDVFCAITERQLMPVMSTLVRTGPSQFACGCNALEIPNNLAPQLRPFKCEIYEKRCSSEVHLSLD